MSFSAGSRLRQLVARQLEDLDERTVGILLVIPLIAVLLGVFIYPVLTGFWYSLNEISIYATDPTFIGLANYIEVLRESAFYNAVVNTVVYVIASTTLAVLLGIGIALLLNQDFRGKPLATGLLLMPYVVPIVGVVLLFRWTFNGLNGVGNYILVQLGLIDQSISWLADPNLAMPMLVVITGWRFYPFVTLLLLAKLQTIPSSYYEAAEVMGASTWRQFRYITLPQLRNVLLIAVFLRFLFIFNLFDIVWLGTGGGPGNATETLPVLAYVATFRQLNLGMGSTIAAFTFFTLFIGVLIYIRLFGLGEVDGT